MFPFAVIYYTNEIARCLSKSFHLLQLISILPACCCVIRGGCFNLGGGKILVPENKILWGPRGGMTFQLGEA